MRTLLIALLFVGSFAYNVDVHIIPEGGHEANELGAAYVLIDDGKWKSFSIDIDHDPEFPIYEIYMEVPYTIKCFMFMNGIMLNYPAKNICGYTDVINLNNHSAFKYRDIVSKFTL